MKLAIMQPYFFPYIGYFQLMASVDAFVIYDNIKYTKKGWINRNRIQNRGVEALISVPLQKGADHLNIFERVISPVFNRQKLCNQIVGAYRHAPYFNEVMPVLEKIIRNESANLFYYLYHSLVTLREYFDLPCDLLISSTLAADHSLKGQARVLDICHIMNANEYINPPGGIDLYSHRDFSYHNISLKFIQPQQWHYPHSHAEFIPWLSIIDVMMFNERDEIVRRFKTGYEFK